MHIVVAIDSFKGSLTSSEAGHAVAAGMGRVFENARFTVMPVADGGEGTVAAFLERDDAEARRVDVVDPLRRDHQATYAYLPDRELAVMEMSAACGLPLVGEERHPDRATTYGFGQMILHGVDQGARRFLIGLGGSATNDGGVGMLQALGFGFYDRDGEPVGDGAASLEALASIDISTRDLRLDDCEFKIACDVDNPLLGKCGASAVYGPQKGVSPDEIERFDGYLAHYHRITASVIEDADESVPGVGAAGGMGYAFRTYLPSTLQPGIELILGEIGAEQHIERADLVVTGEGRIDAQTLMGKTPAGVAALAKRHQVPVVAFAGCLGEGIESVNEVIDAYFPILATAGDLADALDPQIARGNLERTAEQVARVLALPPVARR